MPDNTREVAEEPERYESAAQFERAYWVERCTEAEATIDSLRSALAAAEAKYAILNESHDQMGRDLYEANSRLAAAEAERDEAKAKLANYDWRSAALDALEGDKDASH